MMASTPMPNHYVPLFDRDDEFAAKAGRVPIRAGSMIVWNSRTIHQGWSHGPRLAFPVCLEPRERRDKEALARKVECVKLGLPTTHWASLGLPHGSASSKPGGTKEIPLKLGAHEWLLGPNGDVNPTVLAAL